MLLEPLINLVLRSNGNLAVINLRSKMQDLRPTKVIVPIEDNGTAIINMP